MIATTTSAGMLSQPIPDGRSDSYAAGWAFADVHIRKGGSLTADAPTDWHEEKVAGFSDRLATERAALARRLRTHCTCGEELEPPTNGLGNWGSWRCRKCWAGYCQDCGSPLDYNDQCIAYREAQEEDANE
ncbi:hypothetical protein ACRCPG_19515 [Pseudomonas aeruginosa]